MVAKKNKMDEEIEALDDSALLVRVLRNGLKPLVEEGLIDYARADERARNQAMSLFAYFDIKKAED